MYLTLSLQDFRCLDNSRIDIGAREVFFVGRNGQGKSALLEALYYCAYGQSFRARHDEEAIKHGKDGFFLSALYDDNTAMITDNGVDSLSSNSIEKGIGEDREYNISATVSRVDINVVRGLEAMKNGSSAVKKIIKNGKAIKDRKEVINTVPCVLFCHDDMRFATGAPIYKRFFLNQTLAMSDPLYLDDMKDYSKVLKNRNVLLKSYKDGSIAVSEISRMLDVLDEQLAEKGCILQKKRADMAFSLCTAFTPLYREIADIDGVSLVYKPSWPSGSTPASVTEYLAKNRERDKIMATTMAGPHRDRMEVMIGQTGKYFTQIASTGQLRLVSLLMRLAQSRVAQRARGKRCVLLMDDVMLEIDQDKRRMLTQMLGNYDQLFCTFLSDEPYQSYLKQTTKVYQIESGKWL